MTDGVHLDFDLEGDEAFQLFESHAGFVVADGEGFVSEHALTMELPTLHARLTVWLRGHDTMREAIDDYRAREVPRGIKTWKETDCLVGGMRGRMVHYHVPCRCCADAPDVVERRAAFVVKAKQSYTFNLCWHRRTGDARKAEDAFERILTTFRFLDVDEDGDLFAIPPARDLL